MDIYSALEITHWRLREDYLVSRSLPSRPTELETSESDRHATLDQDGDDFNAEQAQIVKSSSPHVLEDTLSWDTIEQRISKPICPVCTQQRCVLEEGQRSAKWMFLVDAPSAVASAEQSLLHGRSRQLFLSIIAALNLAKEDIYLTSVFKCPPADDLQLTSSCQDIVRDQIELIQPEIIVCFGEFVAQALLKSNEPLSQLNQQEPVYMATKSPLIAIHSLAELLQNAGLKANTWQSLKRGMQIVKAKAKA